MERVRYNRAHDSVTAAKKPFGSSPKESSRYSVGDFLALLAPHIPALYESLVYPLPLDSEWTLPSLGSPLMNLRDALTGPFRAAESVPGILIFLLTRDPGVLAGCLADLHAGVVSPLRPWGPKAGRRAELVSNSREVC